MLCKSAQKKVATHSGRFVELVKQVFGASCICSTMREKLRIDGEQDQEKQD